MSMTPSRENPRFVLEYERGMLRSIFRSLFWAVISDKKKNGRFTFESLGSAVGADKAKVSHWFNGDPNWTINTIAAIAHALGLELNITATERSTGRVFTAAGLENSATAMVELPQTAKLIQADASFSITPVKYTKIPDNSNLPPETTTTSAMI